MLPSDFVMAIPIRVLKILDSIAIIVLIVDVQDPVVVVIQVVHVVVESVTVGVLGEIFAGEDKTNEEGQKE